MISLIVIVIMIREIHDSWALMIVIIPKEVAESHRFTITTTFMRIFPPNEGPPCKNQM